MTSKNRTIPLNMKEQIQVQTQVNLINNDQRLSRLNQDRASTRNVRISEIINTKTNNILRSFSNQEIYKQLTHLVNELKMAGSAEENSIKRIALIQKQLEGLLKRETLLNDNIQKGQNKTKGYYQTLTEKDNELLKLEYKNVYNQKKLRKCQLQIIELQKQIQILQKTVNIQNITITENEIYKEFIKQLKDDKQTDKRKIIELENQLRKKSSPLSKNNKSGNKNDQDAVSIGNYYIAQIQKLQKENELSVQKLNETLMALYSANNTILKNDQIVINHSFRLKYDDLKDKYTQLTGVFKSEIEQLQRLNPSIKGLKNVENLISLTESSEKDIQLINITGWVGIGKIQKINQVSSTEESGSTKQLLTVFASSLKNLSQKYPKILQEIPEQLISFISNTEFFSELITIDSLNNLKQIVTYKPEVIKVQNVYQYNNQQDKSTIFNLRVLIKSLIEELEKVKQNYKVDINLDEGIIQMLKGQIIQGLDVNSVLKLYRPLPKIIQVQKIVERPVYINGTLERAVPICTERAILAQTLTEKAIQIIKQVPVYIQKVVNNPIKEYVEVIMETERIVEIPTIRQVIVEKVVVNQRLKQVEVQKIVPLYQEKIVEVENNREIIVEIPKIIEIEKPVEVPAQKQYIQIEKIVQKPVYLREVKQKIKQIQVINEKLFERDRYVQIQQKVPHIIINRQTVYLDRQVPRFITNTEERDVNIVQIRQKIVPYKVIEEKIIQVPVIHEKQLIREVEKKVNVEVTHFIKGDRQQIIKEVQVLVEKPLVYEILVVKDKQIEKIVPLYHKEEKPIYIQKQIPYIRDEAKLINNQICKIVPIKEEIIKEVRIEVPVPVIVEKEIIKIQTVFVDRIVEKVVEVPRIIEIERIVQKIVPIPRIIEKIVEVPRIIEKIVTLEVPYLQIVEVIREIPVIRQVQVIKEVIIERRQIQIVKQIEVAEKQKIVQIVIEKQIPKQIEVETRIPIELIRQVPVQVIRDRIVQKIVQIQQVVVKDRQVMVPFRHEVPIQMIIEKAVATQKVIQNIVKVNQLIQKEVPIRQTITIPEIVEVTIEKAVEIEVVRQIPGPQRIIYIQVPKEIELLREKIVQVESSIEVPKQVYLYMDKIVHEYHQQLQTIQVPKIVEMPYIVEVSKPQHLISYKQVPVTVQINRNVPVRSIVDQIKQVQKQIHHQHEVEVFREKVKQIIKETKQFIQKQVQKELLREVVINETKLESIYIPTEAKVIETVNKIVQTRENNNFVQKVVQRIVMLPQIMQVTKHIHEITQVQSLGIASNKTIEQHTGEYLTVSQNLRAALVQLLEKFKANVNRQPDLKGLIQIIEKQLKSVDNWINFPKILEIPKEVEKIVEKQKVVLVPTTDNQREATLSYLVEKLVTELRRIKERNRVELQLDEQIIRLFFKDIKGNLEESRIVSLQNELKKKYESMGQWTKSYPFMINSFLKDYFTLNSIIEESNNMNQLLKERNESLTRQIQSTETLIIDLNSQNAELTRNYTTIIDILNVQREKNGLNIEDIDYLLKFGSNLNVSNSLVRQVTDRKSEVMNYKINSEGSSNTQISTLINKLSVLENRNNEIIIKNKNLQFENQKLKSQIKSTSYSTQNKTQLSGSTAKLIEEIRSKLIQENQYKIKRIQDSQLQEIQRIKDSQTQEIQRLKNSQQRQIDRIISQRPSSNAQQINSDMRKLSEELREIKRQLQIEKRSSQGLKKQHQRQVENVKRQYELTLEKKDYSISSIQSVKSRIAQEYERKINEIKQAHERELEKMKYFSKKEESKGDKDKELIVLQDKIKRLEIELQTTKKQNELSLVHRSKNTAVTGSIFTSAIKEIKQSKIVERFSPEYRTQRIETTQSAIERKYVSPSNISIKSQQQQEQFSKKSSSSRRSNQQSKYKAQMTLRQFLDIQDDDEKQLCITFIMIKIIEKVEFEASNGLLHSYSPNNIYLSNLNPSNLQGLEIKFGAPITNKNNKSDGFYLAPQILAGQKSTQKSIVFNLAVIWDELIHGQVFFKSMKDIQNPQNQFKVRDAKLNPILKNTLFQMMNKDSAKRLELRQTKRRLSLQKYIASQSKR